MSKKQRYIALLVFITATVAGLVGVFGDKLFNSSGVDSITWNKSEISDSNGNVIISSEELPGSMQVSENSEFGVRGDISSVSLSPDKEWIAFSVNGAVHAGGWLYDIKSKSLSPVVFQYGGGVEVLEWSPDSHYVAFNVGTPAPTEYVKIVDRNNIKEFVSETGKQLRLDEENGLTPPFSYEFNEWRSPHTACVSLREASKCFNME